MATLGHAARVPRADHRGGVVVAPLPPRKTQVSVLPGRLEPVRTHGRVALVLDSSSAASNLVGNEPGAILLVKEEQAGSVLVDRVASAAAEQEVGAEAALLVGNGLWVLSVQLNLPTVAQTKVGRLSSTQKTERLKPCYPRETAILRISFCSSIADTSSTLGVAVSVWSAHLHATRPRWTPAHSIVDDMTS